MRHEDYGVDDPAAGAGHCRSAKDQLQDVTSELNKFEAKKLADLKTELETFVGTQDALVTDYEKNQYSRLRGIWCTQQQQIENLYTSLRCIPDWKKLVTECVCTPQHDLHCLAEKIEKRKRCSQGKLERARDKAKQRFDNANARKDTLVANATNVETQLNADAGLIDQIKGLLSGPDQAVVLYLFWFKLLPNHKRLMPEDISEDCKTFAHGESPHKLCDSVWCKPCPPEEGACTPAAEDEEYESERPPWRRPAPWLIPPAKYSEALDCAWLDYREAKEDYATKDSAFKAAPDDLASLSAELDALKTQGLEDQIKDCLKKKAKDDTCCKKPENTDSEE